MARHYPRTADTQDTLVVPFDFKFWVDEEKHDAGQRDMIIQVSSTDKTEFKNCYWDVTEEQLLQGIDSNDLSEAAKGCLEDIFGEDNVADERVIASQNTPPVEPDVKDRYLVTTTATGAWVGKEGKVATWAGAGWLFRDPFENIRGHHSR